MGTPTNTKTVRVTHETHMKLMALAEQLNGTADDAISHLLGLSTVRVPVSDIQRKRWMDSAVSNGVSVSEFVRMRVEAAIQYTADPHALQRIYDHVAALTSAAGVTPRPVRPNTSPSTGDRPE